MFTKDENNPDVYRYMMHACNKKRLYLHHYEVSLFQQSISLLSYLILSAARTKRSSDSIALRAMKQRMAAISGKQAVMGICSGCLPCWMSTTIAIYQARLTSTQMSANVAWSGRFL